MNDRWIELTIDGEEQSINTRYLVRYRRALDRTDRSRVKLHGESEWLPVQESKEQIARLLAVRSSDEHYDWRDPHKAVRERS